MDSKIDKKNDVKKIIFSYNELSEIEKIKEHYPDSQSVLMVVLWKAQEKFGWISEDVKNYIAFLLDIQYSTVHGVVSFYTMFNQKPVGKYHLQVCTNISCMLCRGEEIYNHISGKLGIRHNETTSDGLFSLEEVECMGACGGAPMIAVNEDYYEFMDICHIDELIDNLLKSKGFRSI